MIRRTLWILVVALPLACGKEEPKSPPPQASAELSELVLAADPGDAISVADARAAAPKDGVVVVGRIGNIVKGFASFQIVDKSLAYCGEVHAENCPTPWDYCCIPGPEKTEGTIVVEAHGADGKVRRADGLAGLRLLDLVVVKGKLGKDEHGNVTLHADGWFRRDRPKLRDGLSWPR